MDSGKVSYYLDIWKEYMKPFSHKLGYKTKSSGFLTGGIHSVEDWENEGDSQIGPIVDTCIDDLNAIEKTSIYVRWLGEVTLVNPIMIETHYNVAIAKLAKKLQDKGLY
jgi:hypothetical protein